MTGLGPTTGRSGSWPGARLGAQERHSEALPEAALSVTSRQTGKSGRLPMPEHEKTLRILLFCESATRRFP